MSGKKWIFIVRQVDSQYLLDCNLETAGPN